MLNPYPCKNCANRSVPTMYLVCCQYVRPPPGSRAGGGVLVLGTNAHNFFIFQVLKLYSTRIPKIYFCAKHPCEYLSTPNIAIRRLKFPIAFRPDPGHSKGKPRREPELGAAALSFLSVAAPYARYREDQEGTSYMNYEETRGQARGDIAAGAFVSQYGESVRRDPNTTIEDLVHGGLAHRGEHKDANTEQKALDGIATVVLRELSNRAKEIQRLRTVENNLSLEMGELRRANEALCEQNKRELACMRSAYTEERNSRSMYERIINEAIKVLGVECDLDGLPQAMRDFFERIVERGLGYGLFDDPKYEWKNDTLWNRLAAITNRDPETGNRLHVTGTSATGITGLNAAYGLGTATATGDAVPSNSGSISVKVEGGNDDA